MTSLTVTNINFTQNYQNVDASMIYLSSVKSVTFVNHTYSNLQGLSTEGAGTWIELAAIDLASTQNTTISGIQITNSEVGFIKINSLTNSLSSPKQVLISEFSYSDSYFANPADLVDSGGIEFEGELYFVLTGLKFSEIEFASRGNLLLFQHQLSTNVLVTNSEFSNLKGAGIYIESYNKQQKDLQTRVRIQHSTFNSLNGGYNSLINIYEGGYLEVENCTFTNISKYEDGTVFYAGSLKSTSIFTNSVFRNNTGAEGAIFFIDSESKVECHNCIINNNFGVSGGVVATRGGGYFEFYNSTIFNNYALAYPVASMQEGVISSKINNWEIYDNIGFTRDEITDQLILATCQQLWFISAAYIENIQNQSSVFTTTEAKSLFKLVLASLEISNSTRIHEQSALVNAFISSVIISDSEIYNVEVLQPSIKISSSNLTISGTQIYNVTNPSSSDFIFVLLDSVVVIQDTSFTASSSVFLNSLTSEISVEGLVFSDVQSGKYLLKISDWVNVSLSNITVVNSIVSGEALFNVRNTHVDSISNIVISAIENTIFSLIRSTVDQMTDCEISSWYSFIR